MPGSTSQMRGSTLQTQGSTLQMQCSTLQTQGSHTAPEQYLGLKKIVIKTESAAMQRMNIQSF